MTIITSSAPASQDASEFRRRRERLQLGVRELAAAMGVSPGLVSMMQNGKRPIRRVYWLALAQVELRASVEDAGEKAAEGKYEAW
jgi:transcriptional regulator with XRE-family HTH domain